MNRRQFLLGALATLGIGIMTEQQFLGHKSFMADVARIQASMGVLYAGGGVVKMSSDGIEIIVTTSKEDKRSYKFVQTLGGTATALWGSHITAGGTPTNYASLWANEVASTDTLISVKGMAPASQIAEARLIAAQDSDTNYCGIYCAVSAAAVPAVVTSIDGNAMVDVKLNDITMLLRGSATAGFDVRMQADYEITYDSSTRAAKTNIASWKADRDKFMQLRPTTYNAIEDPGGRPIVGLIAEEVEETLPYAACYLAQKGPDGVPDMADLRLAGWDDKQMMATMISVVQQQQRDIEALKARVAALEAK